MIPWVRPDLCARRVLVMQWVDGMRCTDPAAILESGIDVDAFIRGGVVSGLRQLLEFGLFHGDPHPGNIFCLPDGRIAYVDFGNVAELSARNKQTLVDAVVHAVNEDYAGMASDFIRLGFLAPGTDIAPIVPALESIWADSLGQSLADFNFRTVTTKFNALVYQHPIRIPERYALVIRSLLTQEGICLRLRPAFHFLEVAYPYIARRLLTDDDPALRERLIQVLLQDGRFQWARLENLVSLARSGGGGRGRAGRAGALVLVLPGPRPVRHRRVRRPPGRLRPRPAAPAAGRAHGRRHAACGGSGARRLSARCRARRPARRARRAGRAAGAGAPAGAGVGRWRAEPVGTERESREGWGEKNQTTPIVARVQPLVHRGSC